LEAVLLQTGNDLDERETARRFGRLPILDHQRNKRWRSSRERRVASSTDGRSSMAIDRDLTQKGRKRANLHCQRPLFARKRFNCTWFPPDRLKSAI
jgi:hypothetical protein